MASEQSILNVGGGGGEVEIPEVDSFDDMGLPESLLRGVYGYGFEKPSAVQRKAIVPASNGRDIMSISYDIFSSWCYIMLTMYDVLSRSFVNFSNCRAILSNLLSCQKSVLTSLHDVLSCLTNVMSC